MKMMGRLLFVICALVVVMYTMTTTAKPTTTTAKPTTTTAKTTTTTAKTTTTTAKTTTTTTRTTTWPSTTVSPQSNLNGKMVTLSLNGGGISFYPPHFNPSSSSTPDYTPTTTRRYTTTTTKPTTTTRPYTTTNRPYTTTTRRYTTTTTKPTTTTRRYTTTTTKPTTTTRRYTTTTYPPWTTASTARGVSVCVRYLTDFLTASSPSIFTISPSSSTALKLQVTATGTYILSWQRFSYYTQYLKPNIRFWSNIGPNIWTRVCLTVDMTKNVAQVFSGSNISIRKILPLQYVWSGEPVIDFSGLDGQVTDVQMWDYPLTYREIFNYMTQGVYGPYRGSVLTWSNINYSLRGNTLLENSYELREEKPIGRSGRRKCRPKAEKKTRELFNESWQERKTFSQL